MSHVFYFIKFSQSMVYTIRIIVICRQNFGQERKYFNMPRKGENIYKRKDGRWEGRYIKGRDINHKAVYGYIYGKTYLEIKEKLKIAKASPLNSSNSYNHILVSVIINEWFNSITPNVKESTISHYKNVIDKHILPLLGKYDITKVKSDIIQSYLLSLIQDGYSNKTVNDILVIIKSIFKYAKTKKIDLCCNFEIISIKNKKKEIKTLTKGDQIKLCKYLQKNITNKNLGIILSLYTGIRIGELCALKRSDIDLEEGILNIDKTMIRINDRDKTNGNKTKIVISSPKSDTSKRYIPIPEFVIEYIKNFDMDADAYLLTSSEIQFVEPRAMQYYFDSVLKKCGIDHINFHALRHTFATRCVENGFEIKSLSEILGHSSIKITLDRYVHSSMKFKKENMSKLTLLPA